MREDLPDQDLRPLGLFLFLLALSTLLGAAMIGYVVVRVRAEVWPPEGIPGAPGTLWISTALLLASSVTLQTALGGIRGGKPATLRAGLALTLLLALAFLANQVLANREVFLAVTERAKSMFGFTFLMLTGLHGLHVLGGLVPLAIVTAGAWRGAYTAGGHQGVRLVAIYWHYLDAVWLAMFLLLIL